MGRHQLDGAFRVRVEQRISTFERRAIDGDGLTHAAVAMTLVANDDRDACFILTRRPLTLRRHAGQWALPGGRADDGETPVQTAIREVHEEVGLGLSSERMIGMLDDFRTRSGFVITPVVFWGPDSFELTPNPTEVHAAHVVPLHALDAPNVPRIQDSATPERPLICFPVPRLDTTIWAPTAALLYQMREVVLHGRETRVAHFEQPKFAWK